MRHDRLTERSGRGRGLGGPPGTAVALILAALGVCAGCSLLHSAADVPGNAVRAVTPGQKTARAVDPVEVQQSLLRFADEFTTRMVNGVDALRRGGDALPPAETLRWKLMFSTETLAIVSGSNAIADLLDMTAYVTAARMALEEYWLPQVFGESARPMLEGCRRAEADVWRLADALLTPSQQTELHVAIEVWRSQNQPSDHMLSVRAANLATEKTPTNQGAALVDSVFGLLKVDPLSGLDPAVRELAQTRLFAERALYVTQKMPTQLRWQMELLSLNSLELPAVQQVVSNSTQIAESVERFAALAEKLPGQLSAERAEVVTALESQEAILAPLVNEVRQTLAAGTQMSDSMNTTLTAFDAVLKRLRVGEPKPAKTNAVPFRIQDYGQTAAQLELAARQLTELLRTLDQALGSTNLTQLSARVGPAVQQVQVGGRDIVDYAFWRAIVCLAVAFLISLLYRLVLARLTGRGHPR